MGSAYSGQRLTSSSSASHDRPSLADLGLLFCREDFGEEVAIALPVAAEERHVEGLDPPLDEYAREIEEKVTIHAFGHVSPHR